MAIHFDGKNKILACKIRSYLLEQAPRPIPLLFRPAAR